MPEIIPGLRIIELSLEIWKLILEGQTIEQRQKFTQMYLDDIAFWRKVFKIDKDPTP